ncbi:MAG: hypothetical protein ETSY2_18585 [Candidatus Entotheonella gemina]|uniref:Peptidase S9A N-terminal domain-containing protein n=1 Tax=Candidatus Entotheonella gemina TaxID=1429439 RepID=W4M771_9BACT|nr:MAG: hypothetical protein ETSY2_18585 [Candidatus Entotheonella gemina]
MIPTFHDPHARQDNVVENYHGTLAADPYRWLEDAEAEETQAFAAAQHTLTRQYLDAIPARASYRARLTALWDHDKYSVPYRHGGRFYFFKQSGLQNQPVLYQQTDLTGEAAPILDPNTLSHDGTVALTTLAFSEDGTLLAYGLSTSGSDWQELSIRHLDSGEEEPEVIRWYKFAGIAWRHDNRQGHGAGFR